MTDTLLTQTGTERTAADAAIDDEPAAELSVRVIEAVADAADADPTTMAPLHESIDPDALDQLIAAGMDGQVSFTFGGHAVTVEGDGTVAVEEVR